MHLYYLLISWLLAHLGEALPSPQPRNAAEGISFSLTRKVGTRDNSIQSRSLSASLYNEFLYYLVNVTIGTPQQQFSLVLDTGSSDIWVYSSAAAQTCSTCTSAYYYPTRSSTYTPMTNLGVFSIRYGTPNSGVTGYYATDLIGVGGTQITQTFAIATAANPGDPPGGIFGIGLPGGESRTDYGGAPYPGYIDSLFNQKVITSRTYSVSLNGKNALDSATGTIIFGGSDSSKYSGSLVAFHLVEPAPNGQISLDVAEPSISYNLGNGAVQVPAVSAAYTVLLDTGTPYTRIPVAQFTAIGTGIGAQLIPGTQGLGYSVPCSLAQQSGGVSYAFSGPNGAITITVPWVEYVIPDDTGDLPSGQCIFGIIPYAETTAEGLYILGETTLRSAYLLFDYDKSTVSLAQAKY